MPPSPGRIHDLPVKILYSLDTSSQTYMTVLSERQSVYVHPGSGVGSGLPGHGALGHGQAMQEALLGSCYLKAAVRGICFASPECIPNATNLDFSVYNLDPTSRHSTSRAFTHNGQYHHQAPIDEAWTGKGFLSWIIAEQSHGNTLIKGRLVRETEFSPTAFNEQGGLEGLMAAAARQRGPAAEDADGKGWGLEVSLSLKMVNPEGKDEFKGRREFEDMMRRGTLTSVGSARVSQGGNAGGAVAHSSPVSVASNASATPRAHHDPIRRNPTSATSTSHRPGGINGSGTGAIGPNTNGHGTMGAMPSFQHSSSASSSHSVRPSPANHHQNLPHLPPPGRPASASSRPSLPGSSLPPSSIPMSASSSSGAGPSNPPPRPSSSASVHRSGSFAQPNQQSQHTQQQTYQQNHPHSQSNQPSSAHASSSATHVPSRNQSREVTPPPVPQRKSPPPSTPSREKLAALLRTDEKMSPSMAKHLAQNPVLLKLLKAVPPTALNFGHHNGPNANTGQSNGPSNGSRANDGSPDSEGAPTPTPSGPGANATASSSKTPKRMTTSAEGCCNCGVKESELWRTKAMKDGTKKKVCNACGLYFNKHKRMRPAELWGTSATDDQPGPQEKKIRLDSEPIRHSPRLNRNVSGEGTAPPAFGLGSGTMESPRRKRNNKPIPQPSPRMATRASSRQDHASDGIHGMSGNGTAKALDFSDNPFSPSTLFGTSPAVPASSHLGMPVGVGGGGGNNDNGNGSGNANGFDVGMDLGNGNGNAGNLDLSLDLGLGGTGEIDIEALLNSIAAADGQNGFSLDAFFANSENLGNGNVGNGNGMGNGSVVGNGNGNGNGGGQGGGAGAGEMDMSGWVHDGDVGGGGGA